MESIAVTKANMTVARQDALSPFGLLTQLFTEELARRSTQSIGMYRPIRLAYLEDEEPAAQPVTAQIHFDLNIDLLVNRLMKDAREREKSEKKAPTPTERILERIIVREKELRTAYQDTRRLVIESGGKQIAAALPLKEAAGANASVTDTVQRRSEGRVSRQAGEERGTQSVSLPRRSAGLTQTVTAGAVMNRRQPDHTLTLASQALSVPAAGGWTPQRREIHPGYPTQSRKEPDAGLSAGSILLPDVMRRRREAALEQHAAAPDAGVAPLDDALIWAAEGAEQTPETQRVLQAVRRAVEETLRRNEARASEQRSKGTTPAADAYPPGETPSVPSRPAARSDGRAAPTGSSALRPPESAEQFSGTPRAEDRPAADAVRTPSASDPLTAETAPLPASSEPGTETQPPRTEAAQAPELSGIPARTEADTALPAETVYLTQEAETGAPRAEPNALPAQQSIKFPQASSAEPAADGSADRYAPSAQGALPGTLSEAQPIRAEAEEAHAPHGLPAQAGQETPGPAELLYLEQETESEAPRAERKDAPAPQSTPAPRSEVSAPVTMGTAEPAVPAVDGSYSRTETEALSRQTEATEASPSFAVPSEPEAETPLPAETVYLTQDAEPDSPREMQSASPVRKSMTPPHGDAAKHGVPVAPENAGPAAPDPSAQPFTEAQPHPTEAAEPAPLSAVPALASSETPVPSEIVYRTQEAEPEAQRETHSASPARQNVRPPLDAETKPGAAEAPENAGPAAPDNSMQPFTEAQPLHTGSAELTLPSAVPAETETETALPAEIVYRTQVAELEAPRTELSEPPARQSMTAPHGDAAKPAASAAAEQAEPAAPETYTPDRPETAPQQTGSAQAKPLSAVPAETGAETALPAEIVYRTQEAGTEAPRTEQSAPPALQTASSPDTHPLAVSPLTESLAAETALPSAIPAEPGAETTLPAEIVYRTQEAGAEAQQAKQSAVPPQQGPALHESEEIIPEARQAGAVPAEETHSQAEPKQMQTAQTAYASAVPAKTEAETALPAEIVYRTEEAKPEAPRTAQSDEPSPEIASRQRKVAIKPVRPGEADTEPGTRSEAQPGRTEAAGSALPSGVPAPVGAETQLPAEIVYRTQETESEAPSAEQSAAPVRAAEVLPKSEAVKQGTGAEDAKPGRAPAGTDLRFDTAPPPRQKETGQTPLPSALPTDRSEDAPSSAELVYLEQAQENAPTGSSAKKGSDAAVRRSVPTLRPPVQDAALHGAKSRGDAAELQLRTTGHTARDIRVTGERSARKTRGDQARETDRSSSRAAAAALPAPDAPLTGEPPVLVFAPPPYGTEHPPAEPSAAAAKPLPASDDRAQLPAWAKELLEQSGVSDSARFSAAFNGKTGGQTGRRQITWTMPGAMDPAHNAVQAGPAELSFRERPEPKEKSDRAPISEEELERTADKVYQIIEERLRRELRRSGR